MAKSIRDALAGFDLPILKAGTSQRVAYAEALTAGMTVIELQPYGEAALEIRRILKELRA